ncbi:MAG: succinate dehydrogenase, cytochrome b556 subunit [Pseudomonadota bacterium]
MMRASHKQPGFLAAILHRLAGIALAIFLPLHFLALATALNGADALDAFLKATSTPLAKFAEWGIVVALAVHMTLGLRVLAIEFLPWRERTLAVVTACVAAAFAVGLAFLLNL